MGSRIIYPVYLPNRLTSANYLRCEKHGYIYFMRDGSPLHFTTLVREFCNITCLYHTGYLERPALDLWPPRSPDLNPLGFFLWSAVKKFVYRSDQQIRSVQELKTHITEFFLKSFIVYKICQTFVDRFTAI
ncbi:hypothetical protein WH47_11071 [Habropoda laboriosa]|uniref:Transposable element Tc3 transposase n=1 Tax=Habropoda laboriosa TaxID=597456 RepID=A0A0L7QM88_9HYME|nr:hypothetical protein WH47_11071 [Habropoda laboriosa]